MYQFFRKLFYEIVKAKPKENKKNAKRKKMSPMSFVKLLT